MQRTDNLLKQDDWYGFKSLHASCEVIWDIAGGGFRGDAILCTFESNGSGIRVHRLI